MNDSEIYYFAGGPAGAFVINNGPNNGQMTRASVNQQSLATAAELMLGVNYRVGCKWRIGADYRVIGLSGVALPTNQIYPDLRGINDVQDLDSNGSLILHGAFIRAERCF